MTPSAVTPLYLPSFTYFPNTSNKYCPKTVKPCTVLHHSSGTGPGGHVPHIRDWFLRQHCHVASHAHSPSTATAANVVSDIPTPFLLPCCPMFTWRPLLTLWATFPPHVCAAFTLNIVSEVPTLFLPPHCPTIRSHPSPMLLAMLLPYPYRRTVAILDVVASLPSSCAPLCSTVSILDAAAWFLLPNA